MCVGGSSAKTDRKEELKNYGMLENVFKDLRSTGRGLISQGVSDTSKASRYYSAILSGNPSAVLAAAAPEINTIGKEGDAQKKAIANFGNRTGGTNETSQNISTAERGQVADVISGKRGEAAGAEASIGAGETSSGIGSVEGAGSVAADLGGLASRNRDQSQRIHDQAVRNWARLVASVFSGGGVVGGLEQWGQ